jgi:hypothetical protein
MRTLSIVVGLATTISSLLPAGVAWAGEGFLTSVSVMALTNSTKQGGQGASCSTVLTETELTYHGTFWGVGAYFQYDRQGKPEVDTAAGPKFELYMDPFYVDFGYAVFMQRAFDDRSIANQRGKGHQLGLGLRSTLPGSSLFFQFSYKYRTQTVTEQDGEAMDEPLTQVDGYPLFGVGVHF